MTLLSTKLYLPPARRGAVARPRLVARLLDGLRGPLVVVAAGAGFGKSTLLAEGLAAWRAAAPADAPRRAVAWVALDAGDSDPKSFWRYACAALERAAPGLAGGAQAQVEAGAVEPALVELVNACAAAPAELVLALDDYHTITDPAVHTALAWLVDHLPANLHLAIAGRVDPPLPLGRWRVRGALHELRAADLRFTEAEAGQLFAATLGTPLAGEQVAALGQYTEGWAAGLQLAGLSLQGHADPASVVASFSGSHRHVVDYLGDEVLAQLPAPTRAFLLRTAILDRMCAELCEALLAAAPGDPGRPAGAVLAELERANLFLIPLDDSRRWYRYHHLFADLLRHRLRQEEPALAAELHRRAARWFAGEGLAPEAMRHALAAPDHGLAAEIIGAHRHRLVGDGDVAVLRAWLAALPPQRILADPRLAITQGWVMQLTRQVGAIPPLLDAVEEALARAGAALEPTLRAEQLALRAFVAAEGGDVAAAIAQAEQALALLPADARPVRSTSLLILGYARYVAGDTAGALAVFEEASARCLEVANVVGALFTAAERVKLQALRGRLRAARRIGEEALGWARERRWDQLPPTSAAHIQLANVLVEQGELTAAEEHLETAVGLTRRGASITAARAHAFLARLRQIQGDRAGADQALAALAAILRDWDSRAELSYFRAYAARVLLLQGEDAQAIEWAAGLPPWRPAETPSYFREHELLTLARVAVLAGAARVDVDPLALLAWLGEQARAAGRGGVQIESLALAALALHRRGQTGAALERLDQALALAQPEGYLRLFLDLGPPMAELMAHGAQRKGQSPSAQGYLKQILAAFVPGAPQALPQDRADPAPPRAAPEPVAALVEPLTGREREVLRLFAAGLTSPEIAQELVVSVNTIKTQLKSVYGKLDAHSRSEALARARALGLL